MTKLYKHIRRVTLDVCERDDDHALASFRLVVVLAYFPGTPESGTRGPPENYDPGSGDEISIDRVSIDGGPVPADSPIHGWLENWLEKNRDDLCEECAEAMEREDV